MTTPLPGRRVRGSRTGRPVMALLDLLGRRWILRVLWELRSGPSGFRALQARCGRMSPSVLSQRLLDLENAGLVARDARGDYLLTPAGTRLGNLLLPLHQWAEKWAGETALSSPCANRSSPKTRSGRR